ncbi:MAG: hypothetical protein AAFO17_16940 [Pseudomonadota bacterium]
MDLVTLMGVATDIVLKSIVLAFAIATLVFAFVFQSEGIGFGELEQRVKKVNKVVLFGAMPRNFHGSIADREDPTKNLTTAQIL